MKDFIPDEVEMIGQSEKKILISILKMFKGRKF